MGIDKIRKDFLLFCRNMESEYTFAPHHRYVTNKIQDNVIEKKDGRFLLSIGPGNGKSTLCSKFLPAFLLGLDPKNKILLLTYGEKLSNKFGKDVRKYINSLAYRKIFPNTIIEGDGESGTFDTTEGGGLMCVGRGGSITGFRANFIILDDTLKNQQEAKSETVLNNLWEWFSTTVYTRLLPGGSIVAFNTRWTKRDLIGKLLDNYDNYDYVNLPSIALENDPLGRTPGEAIWPEWEPLKKLLEIKKASLKTFEAMYQGNPVSGASLPIKRSSFLKATVINYDSTKKKRVLSWDTANTEEAGDWTVGLVWEYGDNEAILTDCIRKQVGFDNLIKEFDDLNSIYKPLTNIVEKAQSGQQLIQLRKDLCLPSSCIKTNIKEELAESFNFSLRTGKIKILEGVFSEENITEIKGFPYEKHDDIVLSILHFYKNWLSGDLKKLKPKKRKNSTKAIMRSFESSFGTNSKRKSFQFKRSPGRRNTYKQNKYQIV